MATFLWPYAVLEDLNCLCAFAFLLQHFSSPHGLPPSLKDAPGTRKVLYMERQKRKIISTIYNITLLYI